MPEQQVQLVPFIPPPGFSVGDDAKAGLVVLNTETPYGSGVFPMHPNTAISLARALLQHAKQLNRNAPAKSAVQGRDPATGAILLGGVIPDASALPDTSDIEAELDAADAKELDGEDDEARAVGLYPLAEQWNG